MSHNR
ncbi:hypothetical protein VTL71DRAFT_1564 [Oculimacula yallundae]|jgi:hypothetical protein